MSDSALSPAQEDVWNVVKQINQAAMAADIDTCRELAHEGMVVFPTLSQRVEGRESYLESILEFAGRGTVKTYNQLEPSIDIFADTAVVTYRYESVWESDGKPIEDAGHDVWVLVRENGVWLLAWRTLVPDRK